MLEGPPLFKIFFTSYLMFEIIFLRAFFVPISNLPSDFENLRYFFVYSVLYV